MEGLHKLSGTILPSFHGLAVPKNLIGFLFYACRRVRRLEQFSLIGRRPKKLLLPRHRLPRLRHDLPQPLRFSTRSRPKLIGLLKRIVGWVIEQPVGQHVLVFVDFGDEGGDSEVELAHSLLLFGGGAVGLKFPMVAHYGRALWPAPGGGGAGQAVRAMWNRGVGLVVDGALWADGSGFIPHYDYSIIVIGIVNHVYCEID